mmetsp:Transcript_20173/g.53527  ORF Transcript_20173/g.53527 Transcript_20173/m.53527 type:complete len:239 (+) Transcript_20173:3-719(+)
MGSSGACLVRVRHGQAGRLQQRDGGSDDGADDARHDARHAVRGPGRRHADPDDAGHAVRGADADARCRVLRAAAAAGDGDAKLSLGLFVPLPSHHAGRPEQPAGRGGGRLGARHHQGGAGGSGPVPRGGSGAGSAAAAAAGLAGPGHDDGQARCARDDVHGGARAAAAAAAAPEDDADSRGRTSGGRDVPDDAAWEHDAGSVRQDGVRCRLAQRPAPLITEPCMARAISGRAGKLVMA